MPEPVESVPADPWAGWVAETARLFNMNGENEVSMLWAWVDRCLKGRHEPEDMLAASASVVEGEHPSFRDALLPLLLRASRVARATRLALQAAPALRGLEAASPAAGCKDCCEFGYVLVPNLDGIRASMFRNARYTLSLPCACHRGRQAVGRWALQGRTVYTLEQYERQHPNWRDVLAQWKAEDEGYRAAMGAAKSQDEKLGPISRLDFRLGAAQGVRRKRK